MEKRRVCNISELVGLTMANVQKITSEEIQFTATDGRVFKLYHYQDCCETVTIESIDGDLSDLVGVPISWQAMHEAAGGVHAVVRSPGEARAIEDRIRRERMEA